MELQEEMYKFNIPSGRLQRTSRVLLGQTKKTRSEIIIISEALCKSGNIVSSHPTTVIEGRTEQEREWRLQTNK